MAKLFLLPSKSGLGSKSLHTLSSSENDSHIGRRYVSDPAHTVCFWPRKLANGFCKALCESRIFSVLTTLLTLYALFGDDIRLWMTEKPADTIFDIITMVTMGIFTLEIIVFSVGKAGYLFGFFFLLDIISTVTLVLDLTFVSSLLFDNIITTTDDQSSGGGDGGGSGDSAEAARAARASRAGTRAGRVVRLIRLIRLIKMLKFVKKRQPITSYEVQPGDEWDDDHWDSNVQESAVSKKLSEMTTRRVIMLVLAIMIFLPFFQASFYTDSLDDSAQYGINILYRRFRDDLTAFKPAESEANRANYLASYQRRLYEEDFIFFVYHHNWFCGDTGVPKNKELSPDSSFGKLFWIGAAPANGADAEYFLPRYTQGSGNWDDRWEGTDWDFYQCKLPTDVQTLLMQANWSQTTVCIDGAYRGVSLIEGRESRVRCPDDLRYQERSIVYPQTVTQQEWRQLFFMFVFDRRSGSHMEAILNMAQTFFICLLLGVGAMTFSQDANRLVLTPIERMILKLERIRSNPLEATTMGDEEREWNQTPAETDGTTSASDDDRRTTKEDPPTWWASVKLRLRKILPCGCFRQGEAKAAPEPMETVVLEKTIIKIGSLLALGFGEAGAEIIGHNMKGSDHSERSAQRRGKHVEAIYGYCDIRDFQDITEVLTDQVIVFVNRIAGLVHSVVNEFYGSPNQNLGDAFLLVWRLTSQDAAKRQRLADMSLVSFIRMIVGMNKSHSLAEYRTHSKLLKRLPHYRVRMAFGLHSGWAIEGAIGSEFKIDASYLSPHVTMAAKLKSLTKQYHTLIVMSESVVKLMSEPVASECRLIDRVLPAGFQSPSQLFAIDLDDLVLEVEKTPPIVIVNKQQRVRQRYERMKKRAQRWAPEFDMHSFFKDDPDIIAMRKKFTQEFFTRFNMAYLNYEAGKWQVARDMLEATRFLLATEDGPSSALLKYIKQYDCQAPPGWSGYRSLPQG